MTDIQASHKTAEHGPIAFVSMLLFLAVFIISVMTIFGLPTLRENNVWHDPIGTATYFAIIYGPWAAITACDSIFRIGTLAKTGEKYPGTVTHNSVIGMMACAVSAILFSAAAIGVFWFNHIPTADDVKFYVMLAAIGVSGYALMFAAMRLADIVELPDETPAPAAEQTA